MKIDTYTLNSFAKTKEGGNAAGVVFNADLLTEEEMKKIAAYIGFSETAFVSKSNIADVKVRFFTPEEEVNLCGHATIATFYTMSNLNMLSKGEYTQETKSGVLGVEVRDNDFIMMEQLKPSFFEMVDKEELANSLNINVSDMVSELPAQVVSTGLPDILIPVKNNDILNSMQPDMDKITELSRKYHTIGYHVFCFDKNKEVNAYCRNFAPLYGIPEEAATGTSSGALACYLYHYKQIPKDQASNIVFRQGYSMKKPSEIHAALTVLDEKIHKVQVGGCAKNLIKIDLPSFIESH